MDNRTQIFFECLRLEAEDKFKKKFINKRLNNDVLMAEHLSNDKRIDLKARQKIKTLLGLGAFGKKEFEEINDEITKEIKLFMDTKIEQAIKSGKIPPPDLKEYQSFSKRFNSNL